MSPDHSADVKFEIGHVLFIDIVGYSKLLIDEQSKQIQKLKAIVRGSGAIARKEYAKCNETEFIEHLLDGLRKAGLSIPAG
jgi:hypothetical protein